MKRTNLLCALLFAVGMAHGEVVINEIMQSNIDCLVDDLNQFPDSWVEIYNPGPDAVNLGDYKVNDEQDASTAWQLPSLTLNAGEYKIIYCDKEEVEWHTPFRLESGKECTFYIFKNGTVVDQLPEGMKKQPAPNVAYGRKTDGDSDWDYQLTPTPGKANAGKTCSQKKLLGDPVYSVEGKVFSQGQSFSVELALPEDAPEGTEIRYTLNGSEPTAESTKYTAAINVSQTTVVRAKLFCDGYLSPRSLVQSYISIDREVTMPVVSIVTDTKYLNDDKFGILVEGTYSSGTKNYEYNWRRPMNFEVFDGDLDKSCINQLGEARVTGGASRGCTLKSLGIYANKRFGVKRFEHEFFPDQRPGSTDFKSLMLRNSGNDFDGLYMRDAIIQKHMSQYVDIDWQAYRPAIVYINGEYKGMLNIRERSNEDNIYTNYNGLEDIDMVENLWELKEGNIQEWYDFQNYYNEHGHTYAEYDERLDVQEYMNVMILNLYYCNLDFPGNNIVHWKPQAEGGRWRVIVKDTDFGLGLYGRDPNYQVFKWLYDPNYDTNTNWAVQYEHTRLFRRLMEDETFSREFIDRFAIYMGDFMNYKRTWETWQPMYLAIKDEYPRHRELYNPWWPNYDEELNNAKSWLRTRTNYMYNQLHDFYEVGQPVSLVISAAAEDGMEVAALTFNGVQLSRDSFDGKFFAGRNINLSAEGVTQWAVTVYANGSNERTFVEGATLQYTMPSDCSKVEIVAMAGNPAIAEPEQPIEGVVLYEGEHQINWWDQALIFTEETYPKFKAAKSIMVKLYRPDPENDAHFKFQAIGKPWSMLVFPSQALTENAWTNGEDDIHVIAKQDGYVEIPLNDNDKALLDPAKIEHVMLVGDNTVIEQVLLVNPEPTGVNDIVLPMQDGVIYNVMGMPVDESYRGFVIKNGQKYLQK